MKIANGLVYLSRESFRKKGGHERGKEGGRDGGEKERKKEKDRLSGNIFLIEIILLV